MELELFQQQIPSWMRIGSAVNAIVTRTMRYFKIIIFFSIKY